MFMGPLCVATELFLIQVVYMVKSVTMGWGFWAFMCLTGSLYSLKLFINVLQLISYCDKVIMEDEADIAKELEKNK